MQTARFQTLAAGFAAAVSASSGASVITATFTADNHYAIYNTLSGGGIGYVGGNETGAAGSVGQYNWSRAETFTFDTAGAVYIAAWSDKSVAQGLVGQLSVLGETIYSGDARWRVFATGISRNTGDPHPLAAEIAAQVAIADADDLWSTPFVGQENLASTAPWGKIQDIDSTARWMWNQIAGVANPLQGGANHDEYLIFRIETAIPAPGAFAALAGVGLVGLRRRR